MDDKNLTKIHIQYHPHLVLQPISTTAYFAPISTTAYFKHIFYI